MDQVAGVVALMICALSAQAAQATVPASAEQILCANDVALMGTVLDARSHDCRLKEATCYANFVGVTVRVEEIFSPASTSIRVGDEVRASFHAVNGKPARVGNLTLPMNSSGGGMIGFAATGKAITTAGAKAELVGHSLVLAITSVDQIHRQVGGRFVKALGEPLYAAAYEIKDRDWVSATWSGTSCKRWKH